MDIELSAQDLEFQEDVRAFLKENTYKPGANYLEWRLDWFKKAAAKGGWDVPKWSPEFGGPGWSPTQHYIWEQETAVANMPMDAPFGPGMLAPVLMAYGSEEQQQRFLPDIRERKVNWCQGYSEPGAGSDLAGLKTKAVLSDDGSHYVVNGQKIWTTMAHMADWIFCLTRTDDSGKKQEGISFILVDLKTPGIEIKPIYLMDGLHETNMVFYTDVRVPVANTVGEIHKGWSIGKYLLAHERMSGGSLGQHKTLLRQLKEISTQDERSRGQPLVKEPDFARRLAGIEMELRSLEAFNMQAIDKFSRDGELGGKALGAEANIFKIWKEGSPN